MRTRLDNYQVGVTPRLLHQERGRQSTARSVAGIARIMPLHAKAL